MSPLQNIWHGNRFPFDESNDWWFSSGTKPSKPVDWAHSAARGVVVSLQERAGIKHELETQNIDEETRKEIVYEIANIIRAASKKGGAK